MWLGWSLFKRMQPQDYKAMLIFFVIGIVYGFIRINFLKKQGTDLIADMKAYPDIWLEKEAAANTTIGVD